MLHRHATAIRPYPLPTRQHAAARPNSRQIRQMSAMPANLPFRSQFAARPNNRRHHQPTATHPQTTSTPNLSQTLMISRQTLVISRKALIRALASSRRPSHPENPPKSCKSCFRQSAQRKSQPIPNIPKITVQTTVKHSPGHSSVRGAPPILKIPPNPANPASDNPHNPQRKSQPIPNIPKITVQTTVKHSPEHSSVRSAPPILKIPPNPANPASDNPPNANHSPSPISHESQFRQRSNTRPNTHLFAAPLPSRKSPQILQILLQTIRPTQITAHPQYPMTSYKRCYYPLSTIHWCPLKTKNQKLKTYPPATTGAFVL